MRYASCLSAIWGEAPETVDKLNHMVMASPPPEINLLTNEVTDVPIVGIDITVGDALNAFLYRPIEEGKLMQFAPCFLHINVVTMLESSPDWMTAKAFLKKHGLFPTVCFNATVRRHKGHQIFIGDFRAVAIT